MEDINSCQDENTGEDIPDIPLKTYQWEDVRRARRKGGYPWTHLTKPPFEEVADAEIFTMDAYRKSRSSSTIDKSDMHDTSESAGINDSPAQNNDEDIQENKENSTDENLNQSIEITEIEPIKVDCVELIEKSTNSKERFLSVSSSQDIRAHSEQPGKKRKLSNESSHSRISLSKLAIKDKLKSAKQKLKIPKLVKRSKSDAEESKKPKIQKKEIKRLSNYQGASEPVYIHIPLKPPPGETDEYSKYEFESPGPSSHSASLTNLTHFGSGKRKMSLLGLLTELKRIYDEQVLASESRLEPPSEEPTSSRSHRTHTNSNRNLSEKLKIEEITDEILNNEQEHKLTKSKDKSAEEIKEILAASPDAYSVGSNLSQYLDKDDKYEIITTEVPNLDIDCVIITEFDEPSVDDITHSNLNEFPEWTRVNPNKNDRSKLRAKSEEPKRKRKSSIDSSYSRKSLSKLAVLKKLRDAKDSVKLPKFLSFTKSDNKSDNTVTNDEKKPKIQKKTETKRPDQTKTESPLYIHIPLKPPKDKNDIDNDKNVEDTPECETPISPVEPGNNVQLIFLTPPSDEEILDANVPETPSESDQKFFESLKVDELKCIAKKAVDYIYPDKKHLEVVVESDKNEEDGQNGIETEGGTAYWQMHPVLVDVEDGLKLSDAAIAMINEEMAKELQLENEEHKTQPRPELTSQIKKKVSFKKSRAQDGERIYEDVGLACEPTKEGKTAPVEMFRSMSADEEKSYLDEKVIKTTSLEEDYNKWSKITDHEYEPVNPPPEDIKILESIDVKANLTQKPNNEQIKHITFNEIMPSDIISENLIQTPSAQNFQDQIEDRYFNASKSPLPQPDDTTNQISDADQTQPTKSQSKEKDKPTQKRSTENNFNAAIRTQADKIKTKFQGIKKPNISLPHPPKFSTATFSKLKFKKPTFTAPKMPDMPSFATFSLTRKDNTKNSWRKRQYSTESNAGDSKTKKFDFGTYPRIFNKLKTEKKKSLEDSFGKTTETPVFATVPRVGRAKAPKVPEPEYIQTKKDEESTEFYYDKTRGFVTIPIDLDSDNALHRSSHIRFDHDINIDDGSDENADDDAKLPQLPIETETPSTKWNEDYIANKKHLSSDINGDAGEIPSDRSSASLSEHRQGVLEEIDSDQFFLREKGISQDDIDVGKYLSSEIKEAFRNPKNALTQLQSEDREYDVDVTDQSQSSEEIPKRKWLKKPKRKKTPHVSNEQLSFEFGSDPEDYGRSNKMERVPTPTRPKRRSKKSKKKKPVLQDVIPYQETIPFQEPSTQLFEFMDDPELLSGEPAEYVESSETYKNELDIDDDEPIVVVPLYMNTQNQEVEIHPMYMNTWQNFEVASNLQPVRPVRKNKSVKSLNAVEVDSNIDQNVSVENSINSFERSGTAEEFNIQNTPPTRPDRKRSQTRSESVTSLRERDTNISILDTPPTKPFRFRSRTRSESTPSFQDNEGTSVPPTRPNRTRSRARSESTESLKGSLDIDSPLNISVENPCIEEPCIQVICDRMGYAIVDKSKIRDPPLPPSRFPKTPPRARRKRPQITGEKFATVPRPPERPLRNYSTLSRPVSTSTSKANMFDDDKENVDINPYIEIDEDELARRLQSGEVIQKMRERPLPAPPRPPRKARTPSREVFKDISHEQNLPSNNDTLGSKYSVRNEFSSELPDAQLFEMEQQILTDDHEETITHAALVVQPIGKSTVLSHSEFFNLQRNSSTPPPIERIILIEQEQELTNSEEQSENQVVEEPMFTDSTDKGQQFEISAVATECSVPVEVQQLVQENSDDEEMSEIPEEFYRLKHPEVHEVDENGEETDNLKLQLVDIDKLRVNELTDLEDAGLNVSEMNPKTGKLVISGIELPQSLIQGMLDRHQELLQQEPPDSDENRLVEETDVNLEQLVEHAALFEDAKPPPVPPRSDSVGDLVDVITTDNVLFEQEEVIDSTDKAEPQLFLDNSLFGNETLPKAQIIKITENVANEPPVRPPRRSSQTERQTKDLHLNNTERPVDINFDIIVDNEHSESDEKGQRDTAQNKLPLETLSIIEPNVTSVEQISSASHCQEQPRSHSIANNSYGNLHGLSTIAQTQASSHLPSYQETQYVPSQPPLSFYNMVSPLSSNFDANNIPLAQCGKCRRRFTTLSRSSSSEEVSPKPRKPRRLSEPTIPQLTGQLVQSCAVELDRSFRNLLTFLTDNVLRHAEGKRDLEVMLLMLVVLIASLILMSDDGKVEHHHHWEYFNPPREF